MDSTATTSRRSPFFTEGDFNNPYSVVTEFELGSSVMYRDSPMRMRNFSASQRSARGRLPGGGFEEQRPPHFLDACFLCKQPLSSNKDIFMYRGDTPFCSVECRQEQIEMDEAREKSLNLLSVSVKAMRKKKQRQSSSPPPGCPFRTGTLAAA